MKTHTSQNVPRGTPDTHRNVGVRAGLVYRKHYDRMGDAVWLFLWVLKRQTSEHDGVGLVLGGKPVTYQFIAGDTGFPEGTLRRWLQVLRETEYITTHRTAAGLVIRINKAKKFSITGCAKPCGKELHRASTFGRSLTEGSFTSGRSDRSLLGDPYKEGIDRKTLTGEEHNRPHLLWADAVEWMWTDKRSLEWSHDEGLALQSIGGLEAIRKTKPEKLPFLMRDFLKAVGAITRKKRGAA